MFKTESKAVPHLVSTCVDFNCELCCSQDELLFLFSVQTVSKCSFLFLFLLPFLDRDINLSLQEEFEEEMFLFVCGNFSAFSAILVSCPENKGATTGDFFLMVPLFESWGTALSQ